MAQPLKQQGGWRVGHLKFPNEVNTTIEFVINKNKKNDDAFIDEGTFGAVYEILVNGEMKAGKVGFF
jgi:hypothetical protein